MPKTLEAPYEELVDKAKIIFWENGYKSVSYDDLAEALGVSKSTVYNKLGKEQLFIDGLNAYIQTVTDPTLASIRESTEGKESFRHLFYGLADALYDGLFPRNCFMVNTVVEFRNDVEEISEIYGPYFQNIRESYVEVLERAYNLGEIQSRADIPKYVEFLFGVIFTFSVLSKVKTREELKAYFDQQLSLVN